MATTTTHKKAIFTLEKKTNWEPVFNLVPSFTPPSLNSQTPMDTTTQKFPLNHHQETHDLSPAKLL